MLTRKRIIHSLFYDKIINLLWLADELAPKPFINTSLATAVMLGQTFQLNCSASYRLGAFIDLSWQVPNPSGIDVSFIF